jgi:hypothetical protein
MPDQGRSTVVEHEIGTDRIASINEIRDTTTRTYNKALIDQSWMIAELEGQLHALQSIRILASSE